MKNEGATKALAISRFFTNRGKNPLKEIERPKLGKHLPKRISQNDAFLLLESTLNLKYTYRFEKYRTTSKNMDAFQMKVFSSFP